MPGIVGIINKKVDDKNHLEIDAMIRSMMHEPFYRHGKYVNSEMGVSVGWVNHKNSFCDCMPVINEEKSLILILDGEDFPERDNILNAKRKGHKIDSTQNASYLIHLYEEERENFFRNLNGFFQGLLINLPGKKITLFNDRYGMRRLYYYCGKDEFLFASEAKAILKVRPYLRTLDLTSLGEYFSCGCVLKNRSLFQNIFILPGGSKWTFDAKGKIIKDTYFSPVSWEKQACLKKEEFEIEFYEAFRRVLVKYLVPKGKVGLSLTGGLDTRMILAAGNVENEALPCFTYGGMYRDSYDVKVSKKVAEICNQSYKVLRVDREFFAQFPRLAEASIYLSDGCLDVTGAPNLYVAKQAREIAEIRLTGNYGQEVLRRYVAFGPKPQPNVFFDSEFLLHIKRAVETFAEIRNDHDLSFALFKQAPWYQYGRFSVENSQMVQRSPFMDNNLVELVYRAPGKVMQNEDLSKNIVKTGNAKLSSIISDLGKLGNVPPPIINLIRGWRELSFKIEWYYNHRLPTWAERIDNALSSIIPFERVFLGRHKYYHMRVWYRDELSGYLKDVLLDTKTKSRNFWNGKLLEKWVIEHVKGENSFTDLITAALSVELMHRILIDPV